MIKYMCYTVFNIFSHYGYVSKKRMLDLSYLNAKFEE